MSEATSRRGAEDTVDDDRTLRLTRVFAAPREAVFRAWTDPGEFVKWFGPEGCTAPFAELDLRAGGAWRSCVQHSETEKHFVGGVYHEVKAPERLVFTWAWENEGVPGHETTITVEFFDRDGSTELVFTQAGFETADSCRQHNEGWSSSFNSLAQCLAGGTE